MQLDNPLWQFALQLYQDADNQRLLLQRQNDLQQSVNQTLFFAFLDTQQRRIDPQLIAEHCLAWRQQVLEPFRQIRLQQRNQAGYEQCKSLEIRLERIEIALLWQLLAHSVAVDSQMQTMLQTMGLKLDNKKLQPITE